MKRRDGFLLLLALCPLVLLLCVWWQLRLPVAPFFLAPMMDLDGCLLARQPTPVAGHAPWLNRCSGPNASAAHLVESTLQALQPDQARAHSWQLGYTLKVSLLALLQPDQNNWRVNLEVIDKLVQTIHDSPRPLILYLFSTHFGADAPIEPVLARNPDNLGQTPAGPLPIDRYYGQVVYPWSVARTDNDITRYRAQVIDALLHKLCQLPANARSRIKGVTLLGEVHHLFPDFESGMGFDKPYSVTDYSATSVADFRQYLRARYSGIEVLNQQLGSRYPSFDSIMPPAKDIRHQPLARFEEHLDAFADGHLPISGWVHVQGVAAVVKVYLNGALVADAPVHLGRQDVRVAHPEFSTADVGWRHDLDFSKLAPGVYRIDLALSQPGHKLLNLGTRAISVMDKQQSAPLAVPSVALPDRQPLPSNLLAAIDEPRDGASYFFNPLAVEWQSFRAAQVLRYLQFFNSLVARSCLADIARYTHQIVPQFNPSWDSGKYAAQATLQPTKDWRTGISLYGETTYGRSIPDWFAQSPRASYGVTEFHPLVPLTAEHLGQVINRHRSGGAAFLSFFVETRWQGQKVNATPNLFSFDPDNAQFGSDQLYAGIKKLLSNQRYQQ